MSTVEGLAGYLEEVEERLAGVVEAHPGTVAAVGSDALAAGGKRMRPALTFLSSRPGSTPPVTEGTAIELVHMASLVHDDIVDEARLRRGRAAAWTAHGPFAAKATGDHLFARAFVTLAATGSVEPVAALAEASLALARGEALQRLQRRDPETSIEAYVERCALKTGSLFAAACVLGGGSAEFGRLLGIAFQIVDDVLDLTASENVLGKPVASDLREGKVTMAVIHALQRCTPAEQRVIETVVQDRVFGSDTHAQVLAILNRHSSLEAAYEKAMQYADLARNAICSFPDTEIKRALLWAPEFVVAREK